MSSYRLYFLDNHGHIRSVESFECETEAEALQIAERHHQGQALELWNRARLVQKFEARKAQA